MAKERDFDLHDRLIEYAVRIIKLCEALQDSRTGKHICSQILKSGTAPAPNHGEAQSAESRADFVHKLKIALKELRETETWLKVIMKAQLIEPIGNIEPLLQETHELISILYRSIETAKKNARKKTDER